MTERTQLAACWAKGRQHTDRAKAHLFAGDQAKSLCGIKRGDPAPAVTCNSCLYRWAKTTEGRKVVRAATIEAVRGYLAARAGSLVPAVYEEAARMFEVQPEAGNGQEAVGIWASQDFTSGTQ